MNGTGKFYINGRGVDDVSTGKMRDIIDCPIFSKAAGLVAATGTMTNKVNIPAGAYVYKVGLLATTAIASGSGDIDVGDSVVVDRFIDGLTTLAAGDIKLGGLAGSVSADPVGGHYYAAADYIRIFINGTPATGSVKLLVWYLVP